MPYHPGNRKHLICALPCPSARSPGFPASGGILKKARHYGIADAFFCPRASAGSGCCSTSALPIKLPGGVRERAAPVPPRGRLCLLLRGHHRSAGGGKRAGHPLHRRSPRSGFPLRQAGDEPGRHVVHPRVRYLADGVAGKRAGYLYREAEHRKSRRVRDDLHGSALGRNPSAWSSWGSSRWNTGK